MNKSKFNKLAIIGTIITLAIVTAALIMLGHKEKIKVLILPKFEIGELSGDDAGEAQLLYENYMNGAQKYDVKGSAQPLYVNNGVALLVGGEGKTAVSTSLAATLSDARFDFSDAYIVSTGCCGSPVETTVMGDVFVITATADYDLGHRADIRDMENPQSDTTWFHDDEFDMTSSHVLNRALCDLVYELTKDIKIETTDFTREFLAKNFNSAEWTQRNPKVMKGTSITSDNYWKGYYDEKTAKIISQAYGCPDEYVSAEMEDNAVAQVAEQYGMLDRLIVTRVSVDMDVFTNGMTPEKLWENNTESLAQDEDESADIFGVAMNNLYNVTSVIIDAALNGTL